MQELLKYGLILLLFGSVCLSCEKEISEAQSDSFMKFYGSSLMDQAGEVIADWPVKGLPTTYVVAPDGSLAYRAIGSREWDDEALLDRVRALAKGKGPD